MANERTTVARSEGKNNRSLDRKINYEMQAENTDHIFTADWKTRGGVKTFQLRWAYYLSELNIAYVITQMNFNTKKEYS